MEFVSLTATQQHRSVPHLESDYSRVEAQIERVSMIGSPHAGKPVPNKRHLVHMRNSGKTIAQHLKTAGYETCQVGKWHCNSAFNQPQQPQPGDFGFDHWFATQNNASPTHKNPDNFVRNGRATGLIEGFSCQIIVDEAIDWLTRKKSDSPFFLFVAFHEPHEPIASPSAIVNTYQSVARSNDEAEYFANVENMDLAVGTDSSNGGIEFSTTQSLYSHLIMGRKP